MRIWKESSKDSRSQLCFWLSWPYRIHNNISLNHENMNIYIQVIIVKWKEKHNLFIDILVSGDLVNIHAKRVVFPSWLAFREGRFLCWIVMCRIVELLHCNEVDVQKELEELHLAAENDDYILGVASTINILSNSGCYALSVLV